MNAPMSIGNIVIPDPGSKHSGVTFLPRKPITKSNPVIPGLTRNPEVHHWIPAFAGMTDVAGMTDLAGMTGMTGLRMTFSMTGS